jgi:hypothetical protein
MRRATETVSYLKRVSLLQQAQQAHPGSGMHVSDLMTRGVVSVNSHTPFKEIVTSADRPSLSQA